MWPLLLLVLVAIAMVVWNRLREADDVVVPRSRRRPADGGAETAFLYADAGGGDAGCGDGGGASDGGGGGGCD